MSFNVVDISIILILIMGAIVGFKVGVIKKAVSTIGMILTIVLAFILKGPVANFLYTYFPFFKFSGKLSGLSALNIIIYEIIAFFLVLTILMFIYKLLVKVASVAETFLKATIILSIPSKILGAIFGFIETYLIIYLVLIILSMPIINIEVINNSKIKDRILRNTPIVSKLSSNVVTTINDVSKVVNTNDSYEVINDKIIDILVNNRVITREKINKLEEKGKINK